MSMCQCWNLHVYIEKEWTINTVIWSQWQWGERSDAGDSRWSYSKDSSLKRRRSCLRAGMRKGRNKVVEPNVVFPIDSSLKERLSSESLECCFACLYEWSAPIGQMPSWCQPMNSWLWSHGWITEGEHEQVGWRDGGWGRTGPKDNDLKDSLSS